MYREVHVYDFQTLNLTEILDLSTDWLATIQIKLYAPKMLTDLC